MRGALDPTEILKDSLEAYFAGRPARGGGKVYLSLLAALCAAAAALPLVRMDVTARAPGMLRPSIERHRVLASAAGTVARVGVRLGERVRAGQPLVELRPDALAPALAEADSALAELSARRADLDALVRFAGALARGDPEAGGGALPGASPAESAGASAAGGPGAPAGALPGMARYRAERARALREWQQEQRELAPAGAAVERARALAARGLLPPAELEEAQLRRARAAAAPTLVAARLSAAWGGERADVAERLRALAAERERLRAQAALLRIRAPVAGTVEAMSALSPGSWLAAGEEVAVISPAAPLVAEVFVGSREIARIRRGLPVRLLVDALDRHEWGTLPATVADIGDDFALVDGRTVFRVRCELAVTELRRSDGRRARPGKGMGVTAVFVLDRRTLFHLLWDRASALVDPPPAPAGGSAS